MKLLLLIILNYIFEHSTIHIYIHKQAILLDDNNNKEVETRIEPKVYIYIIQILL